MPIITSFEIKGDTDTVIATKESKVDPIFMEHAPANGLLNHFVARTPDGIMVFNVWETLEGSEKTADAVRPQAMELGLEAPSNWKSWELVPTEASVQLAGAHA